jgi:hypothetical protein
VQIRDIVMMAEARPQTLDKLAVLFAAAVGHDGREHAAVAEQAG